MVNPETSRRLAMAFNRRLLTPDERNRIVIEAEKAGSWENLPDWVKDLVLATER
jgi:hypothetical protein